MVLVNEDIKNNKELYDIDAVDKNIDFTSIVIQDSIPAILDKCKS